jgi:hypothetical protein
MLYPIPVLRPADDQVLGEIDSMRDALRRQIQTTPSKWTEGLRKFLTADAVAASNSIEGFKVSTIDVEDLMDGERDVEISDENREETLAYQRRCRRTEAAPIARRQPERRRSTRTFRTPGLWLLNVTGFDPRQPLPMLPASSSSADVRVGCIKQLSPQV